MGWDGMGWDGIIPSHAEPWWQILPLTITNCPSPYSCKFYILN
jgi:hypothetical protein